MIALSVPEIRHLLIAVIWPHRPCPEHTLLRSRWRRRHQYRARQCHYRARAHPA